MLDQHEELKKKLEDDLKQVQEVDKGLDDVIDAGSPGPDVYEDAAERDRREQINKKFEEKRK